MMIYDYREGRGRGKYWLCSMWTPSFLNYQNSYMYKSIKAHISKHMYQNLFESFMIVMFWACIYLGNKEKVSKEGKKGNLPRMSSNHSTMLYYYYSKSANTSLSRHLNVRVTVQIYIYIYIYISIKVERSS